MFLFSKKFLSFLLVMAVTFGGEDHSVIGELTECWQCNGGDGGFAPQCDAKHDGEATDCFLPHGVCGMEKVNGKIIKKCEGDPTKWSENGHNNGTPICIRNEKCYCIDPNNCNKDKYFGLDGGSGGIKDMFPARSIMFWMMAMVAVALASCIGIPTN